LHTKYGTGSYILKGKSTKEQTLMTLQLTKRPNRECNAAIYRSDDPSAKRMENFLSQPHCSWGSLSILVFHPVVRSSFCGRTCRPFKIGLWVRSTFSLRILWDLAQDTRSGPFWGLHTNYGTRSFSVSSTRRIWFFGGMGICGSRSSMSWRRFPANHWWGGFAETDLSKSAVPGHFRSLRIDPVEKASVSTRDMRVLWDELRELSPSETIIVHQNL
jgi:hypothetical protein